MITITAPPLLRLYEIAQTGIDYGMSISYIIAYSVDDAFTLLGIPIEEREHYEIRAQPAVRGAAANAWYLE